jgi:PHD/YefM family antitoxin component YafN of YafNO toxin-antitoxin module
MMPELAETVPAQEIKRRGIGMLNERVKHGPVWIISGNKPRFVVMDADEYRRERHEAFARRVLQSAQDYRDGLGAATTVDELMDIFDEGAGEAWHPKHRVETPVLHGGKLLHPDITSTAELLAIAEGEDHK